MMTEFLDTVKFFEAKHKCVGANMYHWSPAETVLFNKYLARHSHAYDPNFVDFCDIMRKEPVLVRGCYNFSLKSVAAAMYNHGLIQRKYDTDCADGMAAMVIARACYDARDLSGAAFTDLARYNELDCQIMCEIILYFRNTHTSL
jgi:hypothetical protein